MSQRKRRGSHVFTHGETEQRKDMGTDARCRALVGDGWVDNGRRDEQVMNGWVEWVYG